MPSRVARGDVVQRVGGGTSPDDSFNAAGSKAFLDRQQF
jgi:hypothetical protein